MKTDPKFDGDFTVEQVAKDPRFLLARLAPKGSLADITGPLPPDMDMWLLHDVLADLHERGWIVLDGSITFGDERITVTPTGYAALRRRRPSPRRQKGPAPVATPVGGTAPPTAPPGPGRGPAGAHPAAGSAAARAALERLLLDLFDDSELRRFVAYLPGGDALKAHLPHGGAPVDFAHALVPLLVRRGEVDGALFDAITDERPRRAAEVTAVRVQFGV